jgi:RIO kinase 1
MSFEPVFDDDSERSFGTRQERRADKFYGKKSLKGKRSDHVVLDEIVQYGRPGEVDQNEVFTPTLHASRHERIWILNYLGGFFEEEKITDVLRKVKGGKEANVYLCSAQPDSGFDLVAAKLYRPRMMRNLRNDVRYRQGRKILDEYGKEVRDDRYLKAVRQGTETGKELLHMSWIEHEYKTLEKLHAAGLPVPQPVARGYNTILMEYIGELDRPAPTLSEVTLGKGEAKKLYQRLMGAVEDMLALDRIHADLSAYNVLYWAGEVYIIDFPQAVDPAQNREAYDIFVRDVVRLSQYFQRDLPNLDPIRTAHDLWMKYQILPDPEPFDPEEDAS